MKDARGIKGTYYIASLIEEGEHERQDFKFAVPDARKIAHSLSAFANHSGGRLLIGVKDNGTIAGVRNDEDIYMVEMAAEIHCVPRQKVRITPFRVDGGLVVVRAEIDPSPVRPVEVREADGKLKAYYRVADENIVASPLMVKAWRRASDPARESMVRLDDAGRALLTLASRDGGADIEEVMLAAHLSRQGAEELAVSLYAMELVEFAYIGGRFKLTCPPVGS